MWPYLLFFSHYVCVSVWGARCMWGTVPHESEKLLCIHKTGLLSISALVLTHTIRNQCPIGCRILHQTQRVLLVFEYVVGQYSSRTYCGKNATYLIAEYHRGHLQSTPLGKLCTDASA